MERRARKKTGQGHAVDSDGGESGVENLKMERIWTIRGKPL